MTRQRVLNITHDLLSEQMAGPAIRCWEISRQLSRTCDVTLTSSHPVATSHPDFRVVSFNHSEADLLSQASESDILIIQGVALTIYPALAKLGKYLVVDIYDPFVFESYEYFESQGPARDPVFLNYVDVINNQICLGDFFICANERQRDLWLGNLSAMARLTPEAFSRDSSLSSLIDLVPFGVPDEPPEPGEPVLRGKIPGIGQDDFILLWGGGIYNWFDPISIIEAMADVEKVRPDVKLYFMGVKHPNPDVPEMAMTARAIKVASEMGLKDRTVFFNEGWLPYKDRQRVLCEVDAGVSAHFDSIETRFAFRTRILDYLWAGLPILTTGGDSFAELVERAQLGAVQRSVDVEGWKRAILHIADSRERRDAIRERVKRIADDFLWSRVVKPLEAYCQAPYHSPKLFDRLFISHRYNYDLVFAGTPPAGPPSPDLFERAPSGIAAVPYLLRKALKVLLQEGSIMLIKKSVRFLRQRS